MPTEDNLDWSRTSEAMVREIVAKSELYMQSQLQAAIASDQRALTLVGFFIATATAVIGGSFALWQTAADLQLLVSGLCSGGFLLIAAAFCMWAARPCDFYFPGAEPKNWFLIREGGIVTALGGEAENYQLSIEDNKRTLTANEKALRYGAWAAILSPLIAVIVWLVVGAIYPSSPAPSAEASLTVQQQSYSDSE